MRFFRICHIFSLISALISFAALAATEQPDSYKWGVVPQFTGLAVHRDWTPVLKEIEKRTGYRFDLQTYRTIPAYETAFLKGQLDFAYMNPYHAVMANRAQGYLPIVRDGAQELTGILVTRNDSDVRSLYELSGKVIAFPSPNAFAASLYLRALLTEKERIDYTSRYVGTHSNAYRHVLLGRSVAAGAVFRTLRKESKQLQSHLRILYQTPSTPSHPLCAHPRVPDSVSTAVGDAILEMAQEETGRKLLKAILVQKPIRADYGRDYSPLEKLQLEKYVIDGTRQN